MPSGATAGDALRRPGKYYRAAQRPAAASWHAPPDKTRSTHPPRPPDFAQAGSAHTCSIQKFLVHTVREAAEQAIGPHHTLLQILPGDGIIRIPLLYLTAGREGKPLKGCWEPPRSYTACTAGKHGLRLARVKVTHGEPQNCLEEGVKGCQRGES